MEPEVVIQLRDVPEVLELLGGSGVRDVRGSEYAGPSGRACG